MLKLILLIPLKEDIQIEYARELTLNLNEKLIDGCVAKLECLEKGEPEPIGIGIFKKELL